MYVRHDLVFKMFIFLNKCTDYAGEIEKQPLSTCYASTIITNNAMKSMQVKNNRTTNYSG